MSKKRVKRGAKVNAELLAGFLSWACGSRCLDDEADLDAVVRDLLKSYIIYRKINIPVN